MPATDEATTTHANGGTSSAISTAVVHVLREYTGRGPTKAKTFINQDMVTVVLQDVLTKGEHSLVNDGLAGDVLHTRQLYQQTMREALVHTVEEHTERHVVAFLSANHIDPDMAVETFILAPLADGVQEA
jgi:uncharacterized protein YbcI